MRALYCSLCFGIAAALLSGAVPSAASARTTTIAVEAGPIWNQAHAQKKWTTVPGQMSVCDLRLPRWGT